MKHNRPVLKGWTLAQASQMLALLFAVAWIAATLLYRGPLVRLPVKTAARQTSATPTSIVFRDEQRKVYPYSMVSGGAASLGEARIAMSDPAIAYHYAGVDLNKLRLGTLEKDLCGYISYRVGDKIYWTARQMCIKPGEVIYTDGAQIVRGRCLNRYSRVPMFPTRPEEPAELIFDTPVELPALAMSLPTNSLGELPTLPPPMEELTPTVPSLLSPGETATAGAPPAASSGNWWFPIIPIIPPIHKHPSHPGEPVAPPAVVPPAAVPEPAYQGLLFGAFVVFSFIGWRRSGRVAPAGE